MTRNAGRVIAKSDAEKNLRFSPARWLIAAAIFHLAVTCIVYGLGRFAVLSAAFDRNGIAVSFAPDGVLYLRDTIALSEILARGAWLDWFNASSPFHLKLYSISFALTGWLTGRNIMSAEPLNLLCYLAMLVLVFQLGREVFDARAGLLAAVAVALLPSHLLHTTQLLKDPLFEVGMLTLVLLMARAHPATFIFNHPLRRGECDAYVLIAMPPLRFWTSRRKFWKVRAKGRAMFKGFVALARSLVENGQSIVVACNDPADQNLSRQLFDSWLSSQVVCPQTPEDYFQLLSNARAVVTGRLHTAVASFSLGTPFVLTDIDQRTHGFIKTYQLENWVATPAFSGFAERLRKLTDNLSGDDAAKAWELLIAKRDGMYMRAMNLLGGALKTAI